MGAGGGCLSHYERAPMAGTPKHPVCSTIMCAQVDEMSSWAWTGGQTQELFIHNTTSIAANRGLAAVLLCQYEVHRPIGVNSSKS